MTLAYAQIGVGSMEFISSFLLKEHPKANPTVKKGALLHRGTPHHKHTSHPRVSHIQKGSLDSHAALRMAWMAVVFVRFLHLVFVLLPTRTVK